MRLRSTFTLLPYLYFYLYLYTALISEVVDWQVKMLQALGMKSTLITDGNSPINLFTTANGLVGNMVARRAARPMDDDDVVQDD